MAKKKKVAHTNKRGHAKPPQKRPPSRNQRPHLLTTEQDTTADVNTASSAIPVVAENLAISTLEIQTAGFNITLSQNDLIELAVQEKIDTIMKMVHTVAERGKEIKVLIYNILKRQAVEFVKALQAKRLLPKDYDPNASGYSQSNPGGGAPQEIPIVYIEIIEGRGEEITVMRHHESTHWLPSRNGNPLLRVSASIKKDRDKERVVGSYVITEHEDSKVTYNGQVAYRWAEIDEAIQQIKAHTKEVDKLYEELEARKVHVARYLGVVQNASLNPKKIHTEARTKMNKQILKTNAPALKEKMDKLFNIQL